MSVCLYGGTFDPPHLGHLAIAEYIRDKLNIETVLFIPAYIAPHKIKYSVSSVEDRLKMLQLAVSDHSGLQISNVEIQRKGVSYSIDTIRQIKEGMDIRSKDLYFLIGADSLLEFHTWRDPDKILEESSVLVAGRPGFDIREVSEEFRNKIQMVSAPLIDISATMIRQRIIDGKSIRSLVPALVEDYILRKGLYRS
ncbi:MAG: nicotinate (nicotinamide) nucleotide adenylyltransferase [Candidatus Marinimicrobia bacterium]|nr:nicotinate (nicotinamide) nucleotide adenylyltransferase [bacterium]MCG2714754.1 nicotinate (nicotinamide) nucleotide adenylyltransferase [Candidatus Neomarinimicrobiota bacterium]